MELFPTEKKSARLEWLQYYGLLAHTSATAVYTVMKKVQSMMARLGENDNVYTFDLAIGV